MVSGPGPPPSASPEDSGSGEGRPSDPRVVAVMEAVRHHHGADDRERQSRSVILTELARLDRPLDEDADLTHVTASAIVVGPRGSSCTGTDGCTAGCSQVAISRRGRCHRRPLGASASRRRDYRWPTGPEGRFWSIWTFTQQPVTMSTWTCAT